MTSSPRYYRIADRVLEIHVSGKNLGFHDPRWQRWEPFRIPGPPTEKQRDEATSDATSKATSDASSDATPETPLNPDIIYHLEEVQTLVDDHGDPYPLGMPTIRKQSENDYTVGTVGSHLELQLPTSSHGAIQVRGRSRDGFMIKALRVPLAYTLLERQGALLLHASAVALPPKTNYFCTNCPPTSSSHSPGSTRLSEAHVFTADAEAGKTTAARFCPPDARVLSDECVAVFPSENKVLGTPLGGDLPATPAPAILAGIHFLEQAPDDSILPMAPNEAIAPFLRQAMLTALTPQHTEKALDAAQRLFDLSPPDRLRCRDKGLFWPLLEKPAKKKQKIDRSEDKTRRVNPVHDTPTNHQETLAHGSC